MFLARLVPRTLLTGALVLLLAAPAALAAEAQLDDQTIADAIENEISFDQAVPANEIDVRVTSGVVTLTGTVANLLAKERAVSLAETVKGVRSVVNRIEVEPFWDRMDWEIEQDVEAALALDPVTESWEIGVDVLANVATLTGTVDSWQERQLVGKVVKGVRGVSGIDNRIDVDVDHDRLDSEIREEIEAALRWDALVDHAMIDVAVADGEVDLSGTVGSAAEKSRAVNDAWVAGVTIVDSSDLDVAMWAREKTLREDKYVVKSDAAIEDAIEYALLLDPRVLSGNVTPEVENGVVTLRGNVDNLRAKRAAGQDSRNTVGVAEVENRLKVRPITTTDSEIETDIENALVRDPFVERYEIAVDVFGGTAYLSGTVESYFEKSRADDIAASVVGVKEVRNNVTVDYDRRALAYDPYIHDFEPYIYEWYDYEPYYTARMDSDIEADIESEIMWSPFVDGDDVEVTVEDGVATLTGTVDSWGERADATENAYEGGAVWVDNNLVVK